MSTSRLVLAFIVFIDLRVCFVRKYVQSVMCLTFRIASSG
jgi:hypothetical protein